MVCLRGNSEFSKARQLDLVETVKMIYFGVPRFFLIVLSMWLFFIGWNPSNKISFVFFFFGMIVLINFSIILIEHFA